MGLVVGIWGNDKTGKTSLALTFPKPMSYFEFDLGGFDRAKPRFTAELPSIHYQRFIAPMSMQFGQLEQPTFRPSKIITGVKELWYQFLAEFLKFLNGTDVTGVIDTGSLLYDIACNGYLQEKQELQLDPQGNNISGKELRTSLLPVEYQQPNARMRGLIYHSVAQGKHLVLVHHSRDEYKPMLNFRSGQMEDTKTGNKERAGFAQLGDSTDLLVRTYINQANRFECVVDKESVPKALIGMTFEEPTYDKIMQAIQFITG